MTEERPAEPHTGNPWNSGQGSSTANDGKTSESNPPSGPTDATVGGK